MQKWCPDEFTAHDSGAAAVLAESRNGFAPERETPVETGPDGAPLVFRSESGFVDAGTLMASLTHEERNQVFELVEMDVAEEYGQREKELAAAHAAELEQFRAEQAEQCAAWAGRLETLVRDELQAAARASVELALQLAERIVRAQVAVDREVLVRMLENVIVRLERETPLAISVSAEDAAWLETRPEVREKLNLEAVVADRRIEDGGALVRAGEREWDGTLGAQLEALEEVVREMISTGRDGTGS